MANLREDNVPFLNVLNDSVTCQYYLVKGGVSL